uniref:Uncharacterized protein n=1 Tax=Zooxanthella nutricula TaxID=1333877 RepID=A0A7S2QC14_9DINO
MDCLPDAAAGLGTALGFAGGLTQTDWVGFSTGGASTSAATAAYNQAAYFACLQMRQQQIYQDKNYHLGWITIAREDMRSLMAASVNRMNNYIMVGTLIVQTAVGMLLGDNLNPNKQMFVLGVFWITTALSIMFFTSSVLYSVKGQNSAFLNTMRLLTWETRPENPGAYDHHYMRQINCFEKLGPKQMFRVPLLQRTKYGNGREGEGAGAKGGHTGNETLNANENVGKSVTGNTVRSRFQGNESNAESDEAPHTMDGHYGLECRLQAHEREFETIRPPTYQLLYFARMCQFMQIWMSYDTHSKYCLGLGIILMMKGTVYWCIGQLMLADHILYNVCLCLLMAIFTFVVIMIYRESFESKLPGAEVALYALIICEPVFAVIAVLVPDPAVKHLFIFLNLLSQSGLFVGGYFYSLWDTQVPSHLANKYIIGPAGQQFTDGWAHGKTSTTPRRRSSSKGFAEANRSGARQCDANGSGSDKSFGSSHESEDSFTDDGDSASPRSQGSPMDAVDTEHFEEKKVATIHRQIASDFRMQLLMGMVAWFLAILASVLWAYSPFLIWVEGLSTSSLAAEEIPLKWHVKHYGPRLLSCARSELFASNGYNVARINLATSVAELYPCKVNRTIRDIATACNSETCRPFALLQDSRIVDCQTGDAIKVLQTGGSIVKFTFSAEDSSSAGTGTDDMLFNKTLVVVGDDGLFTQYVWRPHRRAFAPLFQLGTPDTMAEIGCPDDEGECVGGVVVGRRLRAHTGGARTRRGSRFSRNWRQSVMQRIGRYAGGGAYEIAAGDPIMGQVIAAVEDVALRPGGLFIFSSITSTKGVLDTNSIELYDDETLEERGAWHVPNTRLHGGCVMDQETIYMLQGGMSPSVYRAKISDDEF